jgi:hypothetical protein
MTPRALDAGRGDQRRSELVESLLPLVAPHLQVHVHDVVVAGRDSVQPVVDAEGALLVARRVVPDDPETRIRLGSAVRPRCAARAELGGGSGAVGGARLEHRDLVDQLAVTEGDLAEAAGEATGEGVGDVLVDEERPVGLHPHDDVGGGEREGLRGRVAGEREGRRGGGRER